jgi:hypothetical protein
MSETVRLYLRVQVDGKRFFAPCVYAANGKLKPMAAMVNGKVQAFLNGRYHLRFTENGKQKYVPVGTDPNLAQVEQRKKRAPSESCRSWRKHP